MNEGAAGRHRTLLLGSFAIVYLAWGASYVANKVMALNMPPLLGAGIRFTAAGMIMLAIAMLRGAALPREPAEWRHAIVMGFLTVLLSNGINVLALVYVPSNQSALLNASSALFIAMLGTFGTRGHALPPRTVLGLVLGFVGVGLVLWPRGGFSATHLGWQFAILFGCFGWALTTLYYRAMKPKTPMLMFTAMQMLVGGVMTLSLSLAKGDLALLQCNWRAAVAIAYLIVFASCLAYAAFAYLMVHTTPARLGTYAYVNPIFAAVFGWLLLGETLSPLQLVGSAVILLGVVLVTTQAAAKPASVSAET